MLTYLRKNTHFKSNQIKSTLLKSVSEETIQEEEKWERLINAETIIQRRSHNYYQFRGLSLCLILESAIIFDWSRYF